MIIRQLTGQIVNLTYRDVMGRIQGTLKECDEVFVCIDPGDDKPTVFVPLTAILHIVPVQKN